ncbi:MAG TPA: hypothetical protein VFP50_03465 [Anaeromyxobacteraceae bacterium]|nr:hypothetical protein [Anaeromyxobacteraceae bacterium]
MPLRHLHRAVDELAMWVEDRVRREPAAFNPCACAPLDCFGPLPPLPAAPDRPGPWEAESPWAGAPGEPLPLLVSHPDRAARGVAILVPPWKIGRAGLLAGWEALLRRAGYEVWLAVPPHHLSRAEPGARSGEGFVSPDLGRLRCAVEQQTVELRALGALARQRPGEPVTVALSLGCLAAALAATSPEATPAVALVAPPLDLAAVLTRTRIGRRYQRLAEAAGAPIPPPHGLAALLAPFDPGARPLVARRVFVAGGRHDGVATPRGTLPLVHGWGVLPHTYPRGHLTLLFACRQVRADLRAFLGGVSGQ